MTRTYGFSVSKLVSAPKIFTATNLDNFITECEEIFQLKEKGQKGFLLDLSNIKKASMLGVLVTYKIVEYSVTNRCFHKPAITLNEEIEAALKKYGFTELIEAFIERGEAADKDYKRLKVSTGENFIIAPQALLRDDKYSNASLNKVYLPMIEDYYRDSPKAVSMIFLAFSEVLLNFWEHAVEDSKSIIVASGSKQHIEIACADTGEGIISSLGKVLDTKKLRPVDIIAKSTEKGVTSKKASNHMCYGLWILDEIVSKVQGRLHIYSQGTYYHNDYGKKKSGTCGYWQGTIVYLALPLNNPVTLCDIETEMESTSDIQINWG